MTTINSFNIYLDTDYGSIGDSDNFEVHLGRNNITCEDGQMIRISLESFNMYKSFANVNTYNNQFLISYTSAWATEQGLAGSGDITLRIDEGDYNFIGDIAENLRRKLYLANLINTATYEWLVFPAIGTDSSYDGDELISHQIRIKLRKKTGTTTLTNGAIVFQCINDSARLFGCSLSFDTTPFENPPPFFPNFSFVQNKVADNTAINFTSPYRAHISTEEHIYLKTDLVSNNLESEGLTEFTNQGHLHHSNILAKLPIDNYFIHYTTSTGNEFFVNTPNKSINTLKFYIRDSKNRKLPITNSLQQSERSFDSLSLVLKVDIIQVREPKEQVVLANMIPQTLLGKPLQRLEMPME